MADCAICAVFTQILKNWSIYVCKKEATTHQELDRHRQSY
jgi:hypothetical protein